MATASRAGYPLAAAITNSPLRNTRTPHRSEDRLPRLTWAGSRGRSQHCYPVPYHLPGLRHAPYHRPAKPARVTPLQRRLPGVLRYAPNGTFRTSPVPHLPKEVEMITSKTSATLPDRPAASQVPSGHDSLEVRPGPRLPTLRPNHPKAGEAGPGALIHILPAEYVQLALGLQNVVPARGSSRSVSRQARYGARGPGCKAGTACPATRCAARQGS
jgi:hypothetical protein